MTKTTVIYVVSVLGLVSLEKNQHYYENREMDENASSPNIIAYGLVGDDNTVSFLLPMIRATLLTSWSHSTHQ